MRKRKPAAPEDSQDITAPSNGQPRRLYSVKGAADYLDISVDGVQRLIFTGKLPVVKLPVSWKKERSEDLRTRRTLLDVRDLDELIDESKERLG